MERRRTERTTTPKAGAVLIGYGRGIECAVRNMSNGGACLVFPHRRTALPSEFSFAIGPESIRRSCQIVWQSEYRVGVRFVSGC
jgi:hypothetical protein